MMARRLRPQGADDLGLRRALSDRLLPVLVAAMVFLATLALAGALAASTLARHWQGGAGSLVTVQVPDSRQADAVAALLSTTMGIETHRLTRDEVMQLLSPWLGAATQKLALDLPAVFTVKLGRGADAAALGRQIAAAAPDAVVEQNGPWFDRLAALARSLQASALLALAVVALVAVAVTAVATRAGLAARRETIGIVHGLGASDAMIARRFANRITLLVFLGALLGLVPAVPVLLTLATLTAPFGERMPAAGADGLVHLLPVALWSTLPALPLLAASIGWATAQVTVRRWLAHLP